MMKRYIRAAEQDEITVSDILKELSEDVDYIQVALETIDRKGRSDAAMNLIDDIRQTLDGYIEIVSQMLSEEE